MTVAQILNSKSTISRYSKEENARSVAADSRQSIILGDDGKYWVLSRGNAEQLYKAGYSYL